MPESPKPINPAFATFIQALLSGTGTAVRRIVLVICSMAMEHHWLSSAWSDVVAKLLVLATMAGIEWLLFSYRTRGGRHLQDLINDYAGSTVVQRDGWIDVETLDAVKRLLPPSDTPAPADPKS